MNFLFVCGGTAGHINPALAVAGRLRELMPDARFLFVGVNGKMEMNLVPREGFEIRGLDMTYLKRGHDLEALTHNLDTMKNVLRSQREARKIIREFHPDAAIGTGGYVCFPVLEAAHELHIPTLVHESNAVPGLTTKMLQDEVDVILVGFEESRKNYGDPTKVIVTGTPVRGAFTSCTKAEAKAKLGLPAEKPLVLSVWGSLGARHMNGIMTELIRLAAPDADFSLIHSAGKGGYDGVAEALQDLDLAASGMDVRRSTISKSLSFGMTMSASTLALRLSMPMSAFCILVRASKVKGFVTMPTVKIPISFAMPAMTGAAPVPVPPPMPQVTNTISAPRSAAESSSVLSSAAFSPTSGFAPAPRPFVSFAPICRSLGARQSCSACTSVFTPMNSTPMIDSSTMRFTALLPAPPTPTTIILQADSVSFVLISSTVASSFAQYCNSDKKRIAN